MSGAGRIINNDADSLCHWEKERISIIALEFSIVNIKHLIIIFKGVIFIFLMIYLLYFRERVCASQGEG